MEFTELKMEIDEQKLLLKETEGRITKLKQRRGDISAKIADMDITKSEVERKQKNAVAQFARDEITEESLNEFQAELSVLDGRRKAFVDAIDVVNADLAAAESVFAQTEELLNNKERSAWILISTAELAKVASTLHRAYVAKRKSQTLNGGPMDFLRDCVYDATFIVNESVFAQADDDLTLEYFG